MTYIRTKLRHFIAAMMLAAFALPGIAATSKFITLAPPSAIPTSAQPQFVQFTFNNVGDSSNFNSIQIDVQSVNAGNALTFNNSGSIVTPGVAGTFVYKSPTRIQFVSMSPISKFVTVKVSVTASGSSSSCDQGTVKWIGSAWTGSPSSPSQSFVLLDNGGNPIPPSTVYPSSSINPACTLAFVTQPANSAVDAIITSVASDPSGAGVRVTRLKPDATVDGSFGGTVSLAIKSGTGAANAALSGTFTASASGGTATFAPKINKAGSGYVLTATSGSLSVNSNSFQIFGYGFIGCNGGIPGALGTNNYNSSKGPTSVTYDPDGSTIPPPDGWGLRRGKNYDGSGCVLVGYDFTPPTPANGQVASLLYDRLTVPFQAASWKYLIAWPTPIAVDPSNPTKGWTTFRPSFSWGIDNPVAGTTDFVPALFCKGDPGDISVRDALELQALLPTMPNDCSATTPSAADGPFCKAAIARPSVYPLGGTAKMCVSQQGFASGAGNTLFPLTEVVDQADGYTSRN